MSNYSPIVTFGVKDSLSTGDPNKVVKGAQLDAELQAIATAVSSKQDSTTSNSGTFTGTFTGFTSATTGVFTYFKFGVLVVLYIPPRTGNSNSVVFTITGLPSLLQIVTGGFDQTLQIAGNAAMDNGSALSTTSSQASILLSPGSGTMTLFKNGSALGWTGGNTIKGFAAGTTITYLAI